MSKGATVPDRGKAGKVMVLAGNHREFLAWCRENQMNPNRDAFYIHDAISLKGHINPTVVRVGRYYLRRDIKEIEVEIALAERERGRGGAE